jgi:hypothetical protein
MKNEQTSSVVYGLFYDMPYEGQNLLGIYFLEGEATAARDAYIATQVSGVDPSQLQSELDYYGDHTVVRHLRTGQPPDEWFTNTL